VLDSQGRALVAGAVTQDGKLRGYVFGRKIDVLGPPVFDHWYPGIGPSEGLGIVRDGYDRIFPVGSMKPGKLARSCVCSVTIVPMLEITKSRSTLPLQPGGCTGPKSIAVPTSRTMPVLELPELPAESSAGPVDDVSPVDELPLVDADTLVIAGPVENPGGAASPQAAARTRATRIGARMSPVA